MPVDVFSPREEASVRIEIIISLSLFCFSPSDPSQSSLRTGGGVGAGGAVAGGVVGVGVSGTNGGGDGAGGGAQQTPPSGQVPATSVCGTSPRGQADPGARQS